MGDYNQAEVDAQTSDLPQQTPKYFYRLRNMEEQHFFQQSETGILCPICSKEQRNIKQHLNKSKQCAEKVDMYHFSQMYILLNATARKNYLRIKKQIQRLKEKEEDEKAFLRKNADDSDGESDQKPPAVEYVAE